MFQNQKLKKTILVILGFFVLGFIGFQLTDEMRKKREVSKEVSALEKEIEKFDNKNKELDELVSYFQTEEFKEREAKEKLNLVKEGEKVVIVKKEETEAAIETQKEKKPQVKVDRPSYYWWWHYFFSL